MIPEHKGPFGPDACGASLCFSHTSFIPQKVTRLTYAPHAAGVNGPVDFNLCEKRTHRT